MRTKYADEGTSLNELIILGCVPPISVLIKIGLSFKVIRTTFKTYFSTITAPNPNIRPRHGRPPFRRGW